jgi:hypothetical protein
MTETVFEVQGLTIQDIWQRLLSLTSHPRYDVLSLSRVSYDDDETRIESIYRDKEQSFSMMRHIVSESLYTQLRTVKNTSIFSLLKKTITFLLENEYYTISGSLSLEAPQSKTHVRVVVSIASISFHKMLARVPHFIQKKVREYICHRIHHDVQDIIHPHVVFPST